MKEIGGYIELDRQTGSIFHESGIPVNCGRCALEYLIRVHNIQKIYLPLFICNSVPQRCIRCGTEVSYYHIDSNFRPILDFVPENGAWLYFINYYGQIGNDEILAQKTAYGNVILDNSQAYFQMPAGSTETLYTCRKFFGVPDGAFVYTDKRLEKLGQDESFERMRYLLGRFERTASEFYAESAENNRQFRDAPLKKMSKLTENFLRGIDYQAVMDRRTENFSFLAEKLSLVNKLRVTIPQGAFMYPLYVDNGSEIRKKLQAKKIYVPTLWPDVFQLCDKGDLEYDLAANILPLPVDQRYDLVDMEYLVRSLMVLF